MTLDPLLICLFPAGGCPAEGRGVQDLGPGTVGKPGRCLGGRHEKCRARMVHRDPGGQALEYSQHLRAGEMG